LDKNNVKRVLNQTPAINRRVQQTWAATGKQNDLQNGNISLSYHQAK